VPCRQRTAPGIAAAWRILLVAGPASTRLAELDKQSLEVRSHALTLREGELDSCLRDRDRTIEELNLRLRERVHCAENKPPENSYRGKLQKRDQPPYGAAKNPGNPLDR
jgi:hypothetical protein